MVYRLSPYEQLAKIRARGQRPEGFVVIGDSQIACAWASRNRFFYLPVRELGEDLDAIAGIDVLVRTNAPDRLRELIQRIALSARFVTVFNTSTNHSEFIRA